jgi:hypothetical protein
VVSDTAPEQVTEMPAAREFTFELADPQAQLLEEIANPALHRKDVMMTYALAIRQDLRTDGEVEWPVVNTAIVARWSKGSLNWIKREAWKKVTSRSRGAGRP